MPHKAIEWAQESWWLTMFKQRGQLLNLKTRAGTEPAYLLLYALWHDVVTQTISKIKYVVSQSEQATFWPKQRRVRCGLHRLFWGWSLGSSLLCALLCHVNRVGLLRYLERWMLGVFRLASFEPKVTWKHLRHQEKLSLCTAPLRISQIASWEVFFWETEPQSLSFKNKHEYHLHLSEIS